MRRITVTEGVSRALGAPKAAGRDVAGMNMILFLTDQERGIQHFPPNWLRKNLPGMRRLMRHGARSLPTVEPEPDDVVPPEGHSDTGAESPIATRPAPRSEPGGSHRA